MWRDKKLLDTADVRQMEERRLEPEDMVVREEGANEETRSQLFMQTRLLTI